MRYRVKLPAVRRAIAETAWAILPDKLEAILEVVDAHSLADGFTAEEMEARLGTRRTQAPAPQTRGNIAVLPVYGTIAQRMSIMSEYSGGTSTEALGATFDALVRDPEIGAIVLDVDSPGGSTSGVAELAAKIHAARGEKPIIAVANSLMASAAYWIASAADEVVVTPSGQVGSIGVFCVHTDLSAAAAADGVRHTMIRAGKYKAEATPYEPLSDDAREAMQAMVDEMYGTFVADVARARGVTPAAVRSGYGEGRVLLARPALAAGMVDRIATLEDVISGLATGRRAGARSGARADDTTPALSALTVSPDTAGGEASAAVVTPLTLVTAPAPKAKEHTVDEDLTAAANGAAPTSAPAAPAVMGRGEQIADLCALAGAPELTGEYIRSGQSVEQVRQALHARRTASATAPVVAVGQDRAVTRPFESFGHQLAAVMQAFTPGGSTDVRLLAGASGMNQAIPSEGGFLVPPQFAQAIWDGMNESPDNLLSLTDNYTVEGESLTFNANAETSRATGSRYGGVQGYWINEADQITKSKPKFRQMKLEPNELAVLVYLTDKLIRNSPVGLQQYVSRAATDEIGFLTGAAIFAGTGAGQPKGITASGAKVTVAKETGQAAATIVARNVSKMWARMHPRARAGAVWLHNVDVEPQLDALSTTVTNVAGTENVGGYADKVFDPERRTLKGRPLVACEFSETLGTEGDLVLANLGWYATGTRGDVQSAMSMHVRFEYAEQAFRFMFEVDGQNWLAAPLTPFKGANTLSNIVTLATRA